MDCTSTFPLGSLLPDFWLPDINGTIFPKDHLIGASASLIIFMNIKNPYVSHIREVLLKIIWEYQQKGVTVAAINPNDITCCPDDSPEKMKENATHYGYTFPFLFDGTQEIAKLFSVETLPDFFLFDKNTRLVYHGRIDDSTPQNNRPVTGKELRDAINATIMGQSIPGEQLKAEGIDILWRKIIRAAV